MIIDIPICTQFLCKCEKYKIWILEGQNSEPCPNCNRVYSASYSKKKFDIVVKEFNKNKLFEFLKGIVNVKSW